MADEQHNPSLTTTSTPKARKRRPYWHVDVKWIFALLLTAGLGGWLLVVALWQLTAPTVGVALTTNVLARTFSQDGLDDASGIDDLKARILASPTKSIQPIEDFPVTITLADLTTLSPRDLRLKIFGQIAQPLYEKGVQRYAQEMTSDPAKQQKFENSAALLNIVTKDRHEALGKVALLSSLGLVVLLLGAVGFSAGFGRLVTPAVVLLVVGLPGLGLFAGLHTWSMQTPTTGASKSEDVGAIIDTAKSALTPGLEAVQKVYLGTVVVGLALLLIAAIGKIIAAAVGQRRRDQAPIKSL